MSTMELLYKVDAVPSQAQIDALSLSVGWSAFADFEAALLGYAVTTSAWTADGQLIAWTSVVSDNVRHAFLLDVMVHPEFQRQGIGRQVVLRAIEAMRERGVTMFHVDCAPHNAEFYAKCGFNVCAGGWLDTSQVWRRS